MKGEQFFVCGEAYYHKSAIEWAMMALALSL
jgi:hypothetical protein